MLTYHIRNERKEHKLFGSYFTETVFILYKSPNTYKNVFAELAFSILCNPHKQRADDWITAYVSFASSCIPAVYAKPDTGSLFC